MKLFLIVTLALFVYSSEALLFKKVKTVKELDLKKYTGRWFEMYSSLIQRQTFQKDSVCTFADYTLNDDGTIKVVNARRIKTPTGPLSNITGVAKVVDPKEPGAINVKFPVGPQKDTANYLVVKLGPVNEDGQYAYTIITSPRKALLWILTRNPETFKEKYEKETLQYCKDNGYNWIWNKPRKTYQGKDCLYPK